MSHSQSEADLQAENAKLRARVEELRTEANGLQETLENAARLHCNLKAERDQLQQRLDEIEHLVPKTWYGDRELPLRVEFLVGQWHKLHEVNQNMEQRLAEQVGEISTLKVDLDKRRMFQVNDVEEFSRQIAEQAGEIERLNKELTRQINAFPAVYALKDEAENKAAEIEERLLAEHAAHWEEARQAIVEKVKYHDRGFPTYRGGFYDAKSTILAILDRISKREPGEPASSSLSDPVDGKGDAAGERGEAPCIRCALAVGITPGSLCAEHSQGAPILESTMTNDDWVCCFCKRGMEESHRDDCVQHGGHDHLVGGNCRQPPGRVEAPCIRCALAAGIKPGALCGEHSRGAQLGDRAPTVVDGGSPKGSGAGECMCDEYGADLCVLHQTGADALAQEPGEPKPEPVVEPPQNGEVCRRCNGAGHIALLGCPECDGNGYYWKPSPTAAPDAKGDRE